MTHCTAAAPESVATIAHEAVIATTCETVTTTDETLTASAQEAVTTTNDRLVEDAALAHEARRTPTMPPRGST